MPAFIFYIFALITLGFGLLVVMARNPITSALSLASCFVGLAALFISLDAYFIGIIQILVYAGAVMVLFLFIIMLMDIKAEEGKKTNHAALVGGCLLAVLLVLQVIMVSGAFHGESAIAELQTVEAVGKAAGSELPTIANDLREGTLPDAKLMGYTLFDRYGFHLQVIGLLLLVGTVGVVVLSKRESAPTEAGN